VVKEM